MKREIVVKESASKKGDVTKVIEELKERLKEVKTNIKVIIF